MSVSLVECSNSASSHRRELLGMLAIHLFLLVTKAYYEVVVVNNNGILCSNMEALHTFQCKSKYIPSGTKNSDVK